jgi:hypothetical protein
LRVRALTHQGDDRDLVPRRLLNVPYDDSVHAGAPFDASVHAGLVSKAESYLGFNHRDVARHVFADDRGVVVSRHAPLQFLPDRSLADTRGPA